MIKNDSNKLFALKESVRRHNELYEIINTMFTEMDYNLTFMFEDYVLGLSQPEENDKWYEQSIYVIPRNAIEDNGDFDWVAATYFSIWQYYNTYADLLRGDTDIIGEMTKSVINFIETDVPYPSTQGTTVTHKTEVVNI